MDIEELVQKYYEEWQTVPEASIQDQMRAALTELAAGYENRIIALNREVVEANERIRHIEVERVLEFAFDDEVRWILGRPNFACGGIAHDLRRLGNVIATKVEDEQAFVLHWMLGMYRLHGSDWRIHANAILAAAPQQKKEGSDVR